MRDQSNKNQETPLSRVVLAFAVPIFTMVIGAVGTDMKNKHDMDKKLTAAITQIQYMNKSVESLVATGKTMNQVAQSIQISQALLDQQTKEIKNRQNDIESRLRELERGN